MRSLTDRSRRITEKLDDKDQKDKENEGNEQVVGALKTYFDKNKDRQYNAKVEYDENKFVKYINLTILPKEE